MRKKGNSSICYIKNFQMEKVHCILNIRLSKDELTRRAEKNKTLHIMGHYNLLLAQDIHNVFTHREGKKITV